MPEYIKLQALQSDIILDGGAIESNTCYIIFVLLVVIGLWIIYKVYKWFMNERYTNCSKKVVGPVEVETCN